MKSRWSPWSPWSPLPLFACALAGGCIAPGFVADPAPNGPALLAQASVVDGHRGVVDVYGAGLGEVFGVSFHVVVEGANVDVDLADATVDGGLAALDRTLARIDADRSDVAFGGTRLDPRAPDVAIADGALAHVVVDIDVAGSVRVEVADAVVRRADGSFVPCAAAGGTLTLEARP